MKKLNTSIRTTEIDELSDTLILLYQKESALQKESYLAPLFASMTTVSAQITEAIRKDKAFSDLEDADALRDTAAMKIFRILEGYAAIDEAELNEPARRLLKVVEKFTGLTRKPYNEETSLIEALLSDLSMPENEQDINELRGLPAAITALRTAQDDFMVKRVQYNTTASEKKYEDTASQLKKPLLSLINDKLVPYLTLMKKEDADKYGHFAEAVENAISAANVKIKSRSAKPEKKEEAKKP